jgi:molecular chaperone HtpG
VLGARIKSARASELLRGSPARLLSPEDAPNREMERVQRVLDRDFKLSPRILELNRSHPLIADLARMVDDRPADALIAPLIEQLFDSALLIEGLHPNPAEMVDRIQTLMEAAARGNPAAPTKSAKSTKGAKSKKGEEEAKGKEGTIEQ